MNKKLVNGLLAATLVAGIAAPMASAAPADVVGTKYESAVDTLAALKVLEGYPDGTFKAENTITRAEFAAVVVRALGYNTAAAAAKGATSFSDVYNGHWAAGYINVASSLKIINGIGNGKFAPNAPVKFEEAVTMLVRALGYEPAAAKNGGYPNGYLVIAAQEDITEDVDGVKGAPASRGVVAQILDNSLTVPKMIQVGYGDQERFEKSSDDNGGEKTILADNLKVSKKEYTVSNIPRTKDSLEDNEIELSYVVKEDGKDVTKTDVFEVTEGFNFEGVYGALVDAYINNDDVVVKAKVDGDNEVLFDAIDVETDGDIVLVDADEEYDLAKNAIITIDGVTKDKLEDVDYAKVVLNKAGDIQFVEAFNWDDIVVVEKTEDDVVFGKGEVELDVEDYTIVKNGKNISVADVKAGDIVFYNEKAEYAEVFTKSVTGEIDAVYSDSFKVAGKAYDYAAGQYLNADDELDTLTGNTDDIEDMQDNGDVTVFLTRAGDAAFVSGDLGEEETTSSYVLVTKDASKYAGRDGYNVALDVLNSKGEVVKYDIKEADFNKFEGKVALDALQAGKVFKLEIDEDGEVDNIVAVKGETDKVDLEDDKYAASFKVSDSVVVFNVEDADVVDEAAEDAAAGDFEKYDDTDDIEVYTWKDAKAKYSEADVVAYGKDGEAKAVVVTKSNSDDENDTFTGLVTDVKEFSADGKYEVTVEIAGEEKTFVTVDDIATFDVKENELVTFTVGDTTGKITKIDQADQFVGEDKVTVATGTVKEVSLTKKTITLSDNTVLELTSEAVVYDADFDQASLRDVAVGKTVTVAFDDESTRFVNYVIVK